jgi:hypothetical protein
MNGCTGRYGDITGEGRPLCAGTCSIGHYCPSGTISATQVKLAQMLLDCDRHTTDLILSLSSFHVKQVDLGQQQD